MSYTPNTYGLISDDMPVYLVRWLDIDHEARYRAEEILAELPPSQASVALVREFGLNFGAVTLVKKILGRHSGARRKRVTSQVVDAVLDNWKALNSDTELLAKFTEARLDQFGYLHPPSPTEIQTQVGVLAGVCTATVKRILLEYGLVEKKRKGVFHKIPEYVRDAVVSYAESDLTRQEIAEKYYISVTAVSRIWREAGMYRTPPDPGSELPGDAHRATPEDSAARSAKNRMRSARRKDRK